MTHHLIYQLPIITCCCAMLLSCGESKQDTQKAKVSEVPSKQAQLIQHTYDGTRDDSPNQQVYKITAQIYDAPALPLGEIYTTQKQVTEQKATKIAELSNLVYSGQFAKHEEKNCTFNTESIAGENGQLIDLTVQLKLNDLEMRFISLLKFDYPVFYEMSMVGKSDRMYVVIINAEKLPLKK